MKTVAFLPMKANSERVKGKNFRPLAGKPLFKWILDALLDCNEIDLVVINTDAREILAENGLTESERVVIRDRKPELVGDFTSMNLILEDDINAVKADRYIMTHTTNPLLQSSTIAAALTKYTDAVDRGVGDSLFGVTKFQTRFYRADGSAINHDPDNLIRTQDLEPWYEENSCVYVFNAASFAATSARIGKKPILFEIPKLQAIDIDEKEDWFLANAVAKGLNEDSNYA
jgi:CMP-N-acetylneuraminic acid synthetase